MGMNTNVNRWKGKEVILSQEKQSTDNHGKVKFIVITTQNRHEQSNSVMPHAQANTNTCQLLERHIQFTYSFQDALC